MASATFSQRALMKSLTMNVKITGTKEFGIRIAIGIILVKLAIWIMCMGIKVNKQTEIIK